MIIGLVGKNCAGKGEVAKFLQSVGYTYYSLSDVLRSELEAAGITISRDTLIREGRTLRRTFGEGVLADRIRDQLHADQNYVVDSIRNPGEVVVLRRLPNFVLMSVSSSDETRFARMQERNREGDPTSLDEFRRIEKLESDSSDRSAQQVAQTEKDADHVVNNDSSLEELHDKLRVLLTSISKKNSRPSWDDYFMGIARAVASRSNCMKRKVAAVLVKDGRVISTGYNGTPRGIRNCYEGGCPRCNALHPSGEKLGECICSHAEENAIVQAAYHGVSVRGATLYTTFSPCLICTKMIINSGISEVVYSARYSMDTFSLGLIEEAGLTIRQLASAASAQSVNP